MSTRCVRRDLLVQKDIGEVRKATIPFELLKRKEFKDQVLVDAFDTLVQSAIKVGTLAARRQSVDPIKESTATRLYKSNLLSAVCSNARSARI